MRTTLSIVNMLALGLGTLVLQFGIISNFFPPGCPLPQLMVLPVVLIALRVFSPLGVIGVWLLGLTTDMASETGMGPWAGSFVLLYGLIAISLHRRVRESPVTIGMLTLLATLMARCMHEVLRWPSTGLLFFDNYSLYAFYEAVLTAAVVFLGMSIKPRALFLKLRSFRSGRPAVAFSSQIEGG